MIEIVILLIVSIIAFVVYTYRHEIKKIFIKHKKGITLLVAATSASAGLMGIPHFDIDIEDSLITSLADYEALGFNVSRIKNPIIYEEQVLCEGHLPLAFTFDTLSMDVDLDSNFISAFKSSDSPYDNDVKFTYFILIPVDKDYIAYTEEKYTYKESEYDNETGKNITVEKVGTRSIVSGVEHGKEWVWKEIKSLLDIKIKQGETVIIDIVGNFKAGLSLENKMDIIPSLTVASYSKTYEKYAWWNSSWAYKVKITLNSSQVPSTQTNFPVCINITDTSLRGKIGSDAWDIAFTNSAGNVQLNHEIELWDGTTGQLVAWVNVTSLSSSTDTEIYMYYGNLQASNQEDVENTWDANYEAVYHMNGNSDSNILDSTSNDNDCTGSSGDPDYQQVGRTGYAVYLDNDNNERLEFGSGLTFHDDNEGTQEVYFTVSKSVSNTGILTNRYDDTNRFVIFVYDLTLAAYYRHGSVSHYCKVEIDTDIAGLDIWTSFGYRNNATDDGGATNPVLFLNGGMPSVTYLSHVPPPEPDGYLDELTGESFYIGYTSGDYFEGLVDEVRFSNIARSPDWMNTCHNTIANATDGGFFTFSTEEQDGTDPTWYDSSWIYRKNITIDSDQINSDLAGFPICINLSSDSDLSTYAQADGDDILFTNINNTLKLNHEIEYYSSGTAVVWVRMPYLNASTNTTIYMYYGNAAASNQENAGNVWDSDFISVYHLSDVLDSTSNNYDLTNSGATLVSGRVGNCYDFERGESDYMRDSTYHDVSTETAYTMEAWFKWENTYSLGGVCIGRQDHNDWDDTITINDGGAADMWRVTVKTNGGSGERWVGGGGGGSATASHYVAGTFNASIARLFTDGVFRASATSQTIDFSNLDTDQITLGRGGDTDNGYYDGLIEEVRISRIIRSDDWIKTTHNSIDNATDGGFFSLGSAEQDSNKIITNATTDICFISATLNGFANDSGISGFEWGTTDSYGSSWNSSSSPVTFGTDADWDGDGTHHDTEEWDNDDYINGDLILEENTLGSWTNYYSSSTYSAKWRSGYQWVVQKTNANISGHDYAQVESVIKTSYAGFTAKSKVEFDNIGNEYQSTGSTSYTTITDYIPSIDLGTVDWYIQGYYSAIYGSAYGYINHQELNYRDVTDYDDSGYWVSDWEYYEGGYLPSNITTDVETLDGGTVNITIESSIDGVNVSDSELFTGLTVGNNLNTTAIGAAEYFRVNISLTEGTDTPRVDSFLVSGLEYASGEFSHTLTSLDEYTTYHYRAILNISGNIYYGDDMNFTTYAIPKGSSESPTGNSYGISPNPTVSITVMDYDNSTINVTWWESVDNSSWIEVQSNSTSNNTVIRYNYTNASDNGTKYWWKIIFEDYSCAGTIEEIYNFTTQYCPDMSSESPTNGSYALSQPTCSIYVSDTENDTLTVCFYNSTDGISFTHQQTNNSIQNETVRWDYTGASVALTTYYWKITIDDGNCNISEIYHFTTQNVTDVTIHNSGIDYFCWLGDNTTLANISISGLDNAVEYVAVWKETSWDDADGCWTKYYGDGNGTDEVVNYFDVVHTYLADSGTQVIQMATILNMSYARTVDLHDTGVTGNRGYNYTSYGHSTTDGLEDIAATIPLQTGEVLAWWSNTTQEWLAWIEGITNPDHPLYDETVNVTSPIFETKLYANTSWVIT